jgi:endonuclease III
MPKGAAARMPAPSKSVADTRRIMAKLEGQHPNADTELNFANPYELLVATILSAQCTDERVNRVTPALFERYPNAVALAKATTADLEPQIQSTGFFRAKSRSLLGMARGLVEQHGGQVPDDREALMALPGIGLKTANVVLGNAFGRQALTVDTHVFRVSQRLKLARSDDPDELHDQLIRVLPLERLTQASHLLIFHGRRTCVARKPLCPVCPVRQLCPWPDKTRG